MHEYTQILFERTMGRSKRSKRWSRDDVARFASTCFEEAPSCMCGCGEKTFPELGYGVSLQKLFEKWMSTGSIPVFRDSSPNHKYKSDLTNNEFQACIASLLGDGYLSFANSKSSMPRFSWNMGNKDHAKFKCDFFSNFGSSVVEKKNPGFGESWFCVTTKSCVAFIDIYQNYRLDNKDDRAKVIAPLLDNIGWAWLYGDDGCLGQNNCAIIHTESLTSVGAQYICDALSVFLDIKDCATVYKYLGGTPKKERVLVRIKKDASNEFFKRIKDHMATGMEYKVGRIY